MRTETIKSNKCQPVRDVTRQRDQSLRCQCRGSSVSVCRRMECSRPSVTLVGRLSLRENIRRRLLTLTYKPLEPVPTRLTAIVITSKHSLHSLYSVHEVNVGVSY